MIERARREVRTFDPKMVDAEETKIIRTDHRDLATNVLWVKKPYGAPAGESFTGYLADPSGAHCTKSRRIEERKQSVVQSKLNKILFWIIVLLIALIIAIWRL